MHTKLVILKISTSNSLRLSMVLEALHFLEFLYCAHRSCSHNKVQNLNTFQLA